MIYRVRLYVYGVPDSFSEELRVKNEELWVGYAHTGIIPIK